MILEMKKRKGDNVLQNEVFSQTSWWNKLSGVLNNDTDSQVLTHTLWNQSLQDSGVRRHMS